MLLCNQLNGGNEAKSRNLSGSLMSCNVFGSTSTCITMWPSVSPLIACTCQPFSLTQLVSKTLYCADEVQTFKKIVSKWQESDKNKNVWCFYIFIRAFNGVSELYTMGEKSIGMAKSMRHEWGFLSTWPCPLGGALTKNKQEELSNG